MSFDANSTPSLESGSEPTNWEQNASRIPAVLVGYLSFSNIPTLLRSRNERSYCERKQKLIF